MTNSSIFLISIGALIIILTILIVWIRHNFRVQKLKIKTGMVETELERTKNEMDKTDTSDSSINISGNTMLGKNKISVRREKTNVTKNKMVGENQIEAGANPDQNQRGRRKNDPSCSTPRKSRR